MGAELGPLSARGASDNAMPIIEVSSQKDSCPVERLFPNLIAHVFLEFHPATHKSSI